MHSTDETAESPWPDSVKAWFNVENDILCKLLFISSPNSLSVRKLGTIHREARFPIHYQMEGTVYVN